MNGQRVLLLLIPGLALLALAAILQTSKRNACVAAQDLVVEMVQPGDYLTLFGFPAAIAELGIRDQLEPNLVELGFLYLRGEEDLTEYLLAYYGVPKEMRAEVKQRALEVLRKGKPYLEAIALLDRTEDVSECEAELRYTTAPDFSYVIQYAVIQAGDRYRVRIVNLENLSTLKSPR